MEGPVVSVLRNENCHVLVVCLSASDEQELLAGALKRTGSVVHAGDAIARRSVACSKWVPPTLADLVKSDVVLTGRVTSNQK